MSHQHFHNANAMSNNGNNGCAYHQKQVFVSPFVADDSDMLSAPSNVNNANNNTDFVNYEQQNYDATSAAMAAMMYVAQPQQPQRHNSGDKMGLKAASHVSMPDTVDAHEYNPCCSCSDCQALVSNFTNFSVLEAFVSQHVPYEDALTAAYGFVPCIGGPHGNVGVRAELDAMTGEPTGAAVEEMSHALFFHYHRHEMREVPADIRIKSYNRYVDEHKYNNVSMMRSAAPQHQPRNNNGFATHSSTVVAMQKRSAFGYNNGAAVAAANSTMVATPAAGVINNRHGNNFNNNNAPRNKSYNHNNNNGHFYNNHHQMNMQQFVTNASEVAYLGR